MQEREREREREREEEREESKTKITVFSCTIVSVRMMRVVGVCLSVCLLSTPNMMVSMFRIQELLDKQQTHIWFFVKNIALALNSSILIFLLARSVQNLELCGE